MQKVLRLGPLMSSNNFLKPKKASKPSNDWQPSLWTSLQMFLEWVCQRVRPLSLAPAPLPAHSAGCHSVDTWWHHHDHPSCLYRPESNRGTHCYHESTETNVVSRMANSVPRGGLVHSEFSSNTLAWKFSSVPEDHYLAGYGVFN